MPGPPPGRTGRPSPTTEGRPARATAPRHGEPRPGGRAGPRTRPPVPPGVPPGARGGGNRCRPGRRPAAGVAQQQPCERFGHAVPAWWSPAGRARTPLPARARRARAAAPLHPPDAGGAGARVPARRLRDHAPRDRPLAARLRRPGAAGERERERAAAGARPDLHHRRCRPRRALDRDGERRPRLPPRALPHPTSTTSASSSSRSGAWTTTSGCCARSSRPSTRRARRGGG